jgi:hypothetical protein
MNNTIASMDAAASVDSDLEKALWNETPETNYFKMMMEDNELGRVMDGNKDTIDDGDSILGGETLASLMGDNQYSTANPQKSSGYYNVNEVSSSRNRKVVDNSMNNNYSLPQYTTSLPTETLAIVGLDDDVSTIANDTVNETTKSFFNNDSSGGKQDSKPRIRLFKEYRSQAAHVKKRSESSTENGEDEETSPETPPGMIRVPDKSKNADMDEEEDNTKSTKIVKEDVPPFRSKRVYLFAAVLAIILLASIIALTVAFVGMKDGGSTSTSSSSATNSDSNDGEDVYPDWPELNATITVPTDPPLDDVETESPALEETSDPEPPETNTISPTVEELTSVPISTPAESTVEGEFILGPSLEPTFSHSNLTTLEPSVISSLTCCRSRL